MNVVLPETLEQATEPVPPPGAGTTTLTVLVSHVVGLVHATTCQVYVMPEAPVFAASVSDGVAVAGFVGWPAVGAVRVHEYVTPALGVQFALSATVPPALVIGFGVVTAAGVQTGAVVGASLHVTAAVA